MSFSLVYLVQRFFYRIYIFISSWYLGSFMAIARKCIDTLESLDRYWAVKINARYIFRPLYQDSGFIARILGFIFRTIRICLALVIYSAVILVSVAFYLVWALIPIYIVLHALNQGAYPFPVWLKK